MTETAETAHDREPEQEAEPKQYKCGACGNDFPARQLSLIWSRDFASWGIIREFALTCLVTNYPQPYRCFKPEKYHALPLQGSHPQRPRERGFLENPDAFIQELRSVNLVVTEEAAADLAKLAGVDVEETERLRNDWTELLRG